jgi:hypothetical protein
MLRTAELDMANSVTPDDVDVFLDNAAWAIRSTYHTVLKASPGAAIFGQDMLFDIPFVADWRKIGERTQSLTDRGNQCKNAKRIDYDYKVRDKVLVINKVSSAKQSPHMAKSHGLSLQFIQMELSGFNAESKRCWVRRRYCLAEITKLGERVAKNTKLE